jgi:hypothetical protein
MRTIHRSRLAVLLLLLITAWLYAHTLGFGFMWDDPIWFGRVVGQPIETLVSPMPDYQFYRPATMLYNRLFLRPDGAFTASMLHAAQIGWHLLNVALVYALSRRLGVGRGAALAVGGLAAWHPFSYQAVAWAAPQQPMVAALQNGAWLAYVEARRRRAGRGLAAGVSIFLFLAALLAQESTVALAILPLLVEIVLYRRTSNKKTGNAGQRLARSQHRTLEAPVPGATHAAKKAVFVGFPGPRRPRDGGGEPWKIVLYRKLALAYPLVAAAFGLLWLQVPRETGYTALAFDGSVALYFLQGFIFPLLGRPAGYDPARIVAPGVLLALAGLALGGLLVAARRAGRGRQALFGLVWASLGVAPSIVGLRYSYVHLASRLFYYSSPGVALLWACALLPESETRFSGKNWVSGVWRTGGAVLLILIALQSCLLLSGFQRTYTVGTVHLDELIQATQSAGEKRLLFVNFPDRYTPKRPPYPLGYWGVTLAPVAVDLGAFPAISTGVHPETISRRMPAVDFDAREAGPYQIDMRGAITPPDELYQLAHQVDAVYLSRYLPDGAFALQWAGDVASTPPTLSCALASFGQTLCLQQAHIDLQPGQLSLTLTWLSLAAAQPHDAIFAHVGTAYQPPIAQDDDDAWLGALPLVNWQPGDTIREQRVILLPENIAPGPYEIRIGVYNRVTGERLPATTPQGERWPDDIVTIGYLP